MSCSDRLMREVRAAPALYDPNHPLYKRIKQKEDIWKEIGDKLAIDGEMAKRKWRNLRDAYIKHLRAAQRGSGAPRSVATRTVEQLGWLRPHVELRAAAARAPRGPRDPARRRRARDSDSDYDIRSDDSSPGPPPAPARRRAALYDERLDATDHIFLGYARALKALPPRTQAVLKMKIARLVMQAELDECGAGGGGGGGGGGGAAAADGQVLLYVKREAAAELELDALGD